MRLLPFIVSGLWISGLAYSQDPATSLSLDCQLIHRNQMKLRAELLLDRTSYFPGEHIKTGVRLTNPGPGALIVFDPKSEGVLRFDILRAVPNADADSRIEYMLGTVPYEAVSPHPLRAEMDPSLCNAAGTVSIGAGQTVVMQWPDQLPAYLRMYGSVLESGAPPRPGSYILRGSSAGALFYRHFTVEEAVVAGTVTVQIGDDAASPERSHGRDARSSHRHRLVFVLQAGDNFHLLAVKRVLIGDSLTESIGRGRFRGVTGPFDRLASSKYPFEDIRIERTAGGGMLVRWKANREAHAAAIE